MNRRKFVCALIVAVAAPPIATGAQTARETARVGFLSPGDRQARGWQARVLAEALGGHGWVEGKNLAIEYRFGGERYERLRALADELVRLKVDLIFAASAPSAQAAKEATSTIPIVFSTLNDPVRAGLVASFALPGANVTGQSGLGTELDSKRLELLKEIVPSLTRATVLVNPSNPMTPQRLSEIQAAAKALKIQIHHVTASDANELDKALQELARARPAALIVVEEPVLIAHGRLIVDFVAQHRIVTIYGSQGWAEQGGLIEYAASLREILVRAAAYVNRILRGAKPADLPVEQPTKFDLVINMKSARAVGVTIPASLLRRADRVIE